MYFKSKKISLLILGATALVCSRAMFFFIDDSEGPNLLIVTVLAIILYVLSLATYSSNPLARKVFQYFPLVLHTGLPRLLVALFVQILLVSFLLLLDTLGF